MARFIIFFVYVRIVTYVVFGAYAEGTLYRII